MTWPKPTSPLILATLCGQILKCEALNHLRPSASVITIGKKHRLNDPQQKVAILQLGIIESASISIQMAERSHEHPSFSTKSQTCDSRTSCSILPCFSPLLGMISNNGLLDSSFFIRSPRGVQNIPGDLTTSPDPQGSALPRHRHRILLKTAQEKGAIAVGCEEVEVWLPWRSVGWFFLGKM